MVSPLRVSARAPDAEAFARFGAFLEPPVDIGGRAHFSPWLEPVAGRSPSYHLNRVAPSPMPAAINRVERHRHAAQLFLPIGVSRYLVTVMPDDGGRPDPSGALTFVLPGSMGVAYHAGTWHAGIAVLDREASFAVLMWRGSEDDDDEFAAVPTLEVVWTPHPSSSPEAGSPEPDG